MLSLYRACPLGLFGAAALCFLLAPGSGLAAKPKTGPGRIMLSFPTAALRANEIPSGTLVFPVEEIWTDFWKQHSNGTAPSVDWSRWQIVGVSLGQQPNPGHSVQITGYDVNGANVTVFYARYTPRPGMMYPQMIVYPYDLVAIPTKGDVSFCESTAVQPLKPAAKPVKVRPLAAPKLKAKAPLQYNVFTDADLWREFWSTYETGRVPAVDFRKDVVVAVIYPPGYTTPRIAAGTRAGDRLTLPLEHPKPSKTSVPKEVQQPTLVVVPRAPRIDLTAVRRIVTPAE